MPYYQVRNTLLKNTLTDAVESLPMMTWAQLQKFLEENPHYQQVPTAPAHVKVKW